ncbi:NUDIX hydrolase [Saccharibacillus sp. O16]|nr:NUDIX hydrolase [Saccharibacillus sp. O16]
MGTTKRVSVAHVFLKRGEEVLLLKRQNTGHDDGKYALPAGRIDRGERADEAAIREVYEECGVRIESSALRLIGIMQIQTEEADRDERIDFFYMTESWQGEPANREPDKCAELRWCRIDRLPESASKPVKQAGDSMLRNDTGLWFDAFGYGEASGGQ